MLPLLAIVVCLPLVEARNLTNYHFYSATPEDKEALLILKIINWFNRSIIDFWVEPMDVNQATLFPIEPNKDRDALNLLKRFNINLESVAVNLQGLTDDVIESPRITFVTAKRRISITDTFPRYFAIQHLLNMYKNRYSHVNVFSIGFSFEKRNISAIKFSTGNSPKKLVCVEVGIHAREWLGIASTLKIIERMATKYGVDPEVDELLNKYDWLFVPVMNPDGYEFSHTNDRMWRKNRHPFGDCIGVDLNRNFAAFWDTGSNDKPCEADYRGTAVNSEPETQAMVKLVNFTSNQTMIAYFTVHTYSQFILTPYGFTKKEPSDGPLLRKLGQSAADAMKKIDGRTFFVGNGAALSYYYTGASSDWVKISRNAKFTFSFELRPNQNTVGGFILPVTEIDASYRELFVGLQAIVRGIIKLGY